MWSGVIIPPWRQTWRRPRTWWWHFSASRGSWLRLLTFWRITLLQLHQTAVASTWIISCYWQSCQCVCQVIVWEKRDPKSAAGTSLWIRVLVLVLSIETERICGFCGSYGQNYSCWQKGLQLTSIQSFSQTKLYISDIWSMIYYPRALTFTISLGLWVRKEHEQHLLSNSIIFIVHLSPLGQQLNSLKSW